MRRTNCARCDREGLDAERVDDQGDMVIALRSRLGATCFGWGLQDLAYGMNTTLVISAII